MGQARYEASGTVATGLLPDLQRGLADLLDGIRNWRVSYLMGTSEIRRRYARSRIGQFWFTISAAITVLSLGLVWSLLWRLPIAEMLPFFAVGYLVWLYLLAFFTEATSAFVNNGSYYLNQRMSFSTAIYALAYRNFLTLAHNFVIVPCIMLLFGVPIGLGALAALAGLLLVTVTGLSAAYLTALLCTRYRDVTQVVMNGMQIAFFMTPVLWKEQLLPTERRWIADYNPFAVFLSVVRDPILGIPVPTERWTYALLISAVAALAAIVMVGRFKRRIVFWL